MLTGGRAGAARYLSEKKGDSMRRLAIPASWPRLVLGLAVPAVLVVAGGGSALAASVPAATGPGCTVSWVGHAGSQPLWTIGKNWSTGKVPGPADDVCITLEGVEVTSNASINVHSLHVGGSEGIALIGTATSPLTATIATVLDLARGPISRMDVYNTSLTAARIIDHSGTIFTDGNSVFTSPDISFGSGASLESFNGTTTLSSLAQLSDGTLTGMTIDTSNATVVLPGDIRHLVSASVSVSGAIRDPAGHNALTGLTSVDAQSSLSDSNQLPLTGSLVADGSVTLAGPGTSLAGTYTQAQGVLTLDTNLQVSQVLIQHGAGVLFNRGTVAGNLVNDGTAQTEGSAAVTGDYTQASDATLAVAFGFPLAVTGTATVAGAVSGGDPLPVTGATAQVITAGTLTGHFSSHNLGLILTTKTNEIDEVILPQVAVSPATVAPGGTVTLTGASFVIGTVKVFLDHVTGTPLATPGASYFGRFTGPVTIPSSVSAGSHRLIAVGSDGARAKIMITVN